MFRIEGIPVIIRFKTKDYSDEELIAERIEGIPVIIRFKTKFMRTLGVIGGISIEGIPVIIRFKTVWK